jgi:hypothetical protein
VEADATTVVDVEADACAMAVLAASVISLVFPNPCNICSNLL